MAETFTDIELRIQAEKSLMTDPSNDFRVTQPASCLGCGGAAHGGTTASMTCLANALIQARADGLKDREEVARYRQKDKDWQAVIARNAAQSIEFDRTRGPGRK